MRATTWAADGGSNHTAAGTNIGVLFDDGQHLTVKLRQAVVVFVLQLGAQPSIVASTRTRTRASVDVRTTGHGGGLLKRLSHAQLYQRAQGPSPHDKGSTTRLATCNTSHCHCTGRHNCVGAVPGP